MTAAENAIQHAVFGIEQALACFAAGQDLDEPEVLAAAFAPDASLDFRQPASVLGMTIDIMRGQQEIVSTIIAATDHLITSHTISNVRLVDLSASVARAHALIEAMHIERTSPGQRLLLKNSLDITAVRINDAWKISALRFTNLWSEGAAAVLFPASETADV